jgi:hypothetical protein
MSTPARTDPGSVTVLLVSSVETARRSVMNMDMITLTLVVMALGITLMEVVAGNSHPGMPSQGGKGLHVHDGHRRKATKSG